VAAGSAAFLCRTEQVLGKLWLGEAIAHSLGAGKVGGTWGGPRKIGENGGCTFAALSTGRPGIKKTGQRRTAPWEKFQP